MVSNYFFKNKFISVGDLFKKNSDDTITEKILINKEVGVIELTEALRGFSAPDVLETGQRFILVIDNLDRVNSDKVKELWSDMELICGAASGSFKIIVPYSSRHVAAALKADDSGGHEFISKRIPVNFAVPPLITAGWQDVFIHYWKETVSEDVTDAKETIRIIERWLPEHYNKITPRLLKKVVNDIHILSLTVGKNEHRHVLIALYLFFTRYNFLDLKILISKPELLNETPFISASLIDKLKDTHSQMVFLFPNREQEWSEYIISVHYQSDVSIARSELIDEPLMVAINEKKHESVEALSLIWGFTSAWERTFSRFNLMKWIIVLSRMGSAYVENLTSEIKSTVLTCNRVLYKDTDFHANKALAEAIYSLYNSKVFAKEDFMNLRHKQLIDVLNQMHESDTFQTEDINDILFEVNVYSDIYSVNILANEIDYYVSGKLYVQYLAQYKDSFPHLKIDELEIEHEQAKQAIIFIVNNPEVINLLHPMISKHISSGFISKLEFDATDNIFPENINQIMLKFKNGTAVRNFDDFELLLLHPEWRNEDLHQFYSLQADFIENNLEEFCAHLIAHMIAANVFTGVALLPDNLDKEKFNSIMFTYLCWQYSFSNVIDSLKNERVCNYILPAFTQIVDQNRIHALHVLRYITTDYTFLSNLIKGVNLLQPLINRFSALQRQIETVRMEALSPVFLEDVNNSESLKPIVKQLMMKALEVAQTEVSLTEFLSKQHANTEYIFGHFNASDKDIFACFDVNIFAEWFKNTDKKSLSKHLKMRVIFDALPVKLQGEMINSLSDILYDRSVEVVRRITLIHCFGEKLNYMEVERNESRRTISALYPESVNDGLLSSWLDRQDLSFSKWLPEDINTVLDIILENQEIFPITCTKSRYIVNRIKDLKEITENIATAEEDKPTLTE